MSDHGIHGQAPLRGLSARKLRPFADLIRGKYADDALEILKFMPNRGARLIEQVLKSAMGNAEDQGARNVGDLIVDEARGDGGPMFKRLMPRARGMAYLIKRRLCPHRTSACPTAEEDDRGARPSRGSDPPPPPDAVRRRATGRR